MAAVQDAGIAFDSFHFVGAEFDNLLTQHGVREAQLRLASRCACWDLSTGEPDPACKVCYPFGYVYDAAVKVAVFGPNRKPMRRFEQVGVFDPGDAYFTFPVGVVPSFGSRIILPESVILVDDILTKGKYDISRFSHVVSLDKAYYSVRTPPTGSPYVVSNVDLVIPPASAPDIKLNPALLRQVQWQSTTNATAVATGQSYVVRLKVFVEYVCFDPQDRQENGKPMPMRWMCKRMDFMKHPRSSTDLTYPN